MRRVIGEQVGTLTLWVIYDRPPEHPHEFVLRAQHVSRGTVSISDECRAASTVDELRALLPPGLVCIGRQPSDHPTILEVWI